MIFINQQKFSVFTIKNMVNWNNSCKLYEYLHVIQYLCCTLGWSIENHHNLIY